MEGSVKNALRERLLAERRALSGPEAASRARAVQERFLATDAYRSSGRIALYWSVRGEVSTDAVLTRAFEDGKEVCLPVTDVGDGVGANDGGDSTCRIHFAVLEDTGELRIGPHGIKEPAKGATRRDPAGIDCIVLPGVAFDRRGGRLGHGAGCYDRALAGVETTTVAFAYAFQLMGEEIPLEEHDIRVDMVVTEEEMIII